MRKKLVKLRLISHGEDDMIYKKAQQIKEAYGEEFSQYSTMKLKASIVSMEVMPDVDMSYEFMAKDGYKFRTNLSVGIDFFFPNT